MSDFDLHGTDTTMLGAVNKRVFPGGVLLVAKDHRVIFEKAYGVTDYGSGRKADTDTIYDLASLTKPLATSLALAKLTEEKRIGLDDNIEKFIYRFSGTDKAGIKVRQLLTHNSGLPAHREYFKILRDLPPEARVERQRELLVNEPLENPIGYKTIYSDIGFMILAWLIEERSKIPFNSYVSDYLYTPLGINNLFFQTSSPPEGSVIAPTENCPWRNKLICGEVHDDNAFSVGGVDGHAGLFGTAGGIYKLLDQLLLIYRKRGGSNFFKHSTVKAFFTKDSSSGRALGFDMPSATGSSSGDFFSGTSIGHLGFTGTSFWMDLEKSIIVILLTNRVHPTRDNIQIRKFRPIIHDQIMRELKI